MIRSLVVLALTAHASICFAQVQAPPDLPVVAAKVTSLGTMRSTAPGEAVVPWDVSLSPNGAFMAFNTDIDLRIWNVSTRRYHLVVGNFVQSPSWSPNGDAIAFLRRDEQGIDHAWMIRMNPTTGVAEATAQRVGLSAARCCASPIFSPDGRAIAYIRNDGGARTSLTVVVGVGGPERVLAAGVEIDQLRWAPDGASMFYSAYADSTRTQRGLYRVPTNGGHSQLLRDLTGESGVSGVTADGRFVVLRQPLTSSEASEVLTDLDGTPRVRLTLPGDVRISDRGYNPHRVAAVRVSRPTGLLSYDAATGRMRELLDSTREVTGVTWFRDGRRVAVLVRDDAEQTLIVMNADGSGQRRFPLSVPAQRRGGGGEAFLQVSPDGRYALFVSDLQRMLEVVDLSTGAQRTVAHGAERAFATPMWNADSKSIRVIRHDPPPNASRAVHEVTLSGAERLIRALPTSNYPEVVWGIDPNTIAAFGRQSGYTLVHLDGRADQVLLRPPLFVLDAGAISPDRKMVAVSGTTGQSTTITLLSLVDGSRRDVTVPFLGGLKTFDATGRAITIIGRDSPNGPVSIYSVPLDGEAPRVLTRFTTNQHGYLDMWAPDGRSFLFRSGPAPAPRVSFLLLDWSEVSTKVPPRQTERGRSQH